VAILDFECISQGFGGDFLSCDTGQTSNLCGGTLAVHTELAVGECQASGQDVSTKPLLLHLPSPSATLLSAPPGTRNWLVSGPTGK